MAGPPRIVFKDSPSSPPMPTIVFRNKDDTLTDAAALVRSAAFSIALPTPQTLYSSVRKTQDLDPGSAPQLSFSELATHGAGLTAEQAQELAAEQAQLAAPPQMTVHPGRSIPQAAAEAAYPDMLASTAPSLYGHAAGQYPEGMLAASMHQQMPTLQEQQKYAAHMYSMLQQRPQDAAGQMLQGLPHQQSPVQPDPLIGYQYASTPLEHAPESAGASDLPDASSTVRAAPLQCTRTQGVCQRARRLAHSSCRIPQSAEPPPICAVHVQFQTGRSPASQGALLLVTAFF